jgi:hypothetical protein
VATGNSLVKRTSAFSMIRGIGSYPPSPERFHSFFSATDAAASLFPRRPGRHSFCVSQSFQFLTERKPVGFVLCSQTILFGNKRGFELSEFAESGLP